MYAEWPKSPCKLKLFRKNSLINLLQKLQLGRHTCCITILRKIILKISNHFKIKKSMPMLKTLYPRTMGLHSRTLFSFKFVLNYPLAIQKAVSWYVQHQNSETDHWMIPNGVYAHQCTKVGKITRSLRQRSN